MFFATRLLGPIALAAAFALTAFAAPAPAVAADPKVRVVVDLGDVIFRSGHPYYRHGGYADRLIVERDRWNRPVYYRYAPRDYRSGPHYGNAWGDHRDRDLRERRICDSRGRCRVEYYDPRYDDTRYDSRRYDSRRYDSRRYDDRYYSRHDRRDDRRWGDRRWDDRRHWKHERDD